MSSQPSFSDSYHGAFPSRSSTADKSTAAPTVAEGIPEGFLEEAFAFIHAVQAAPGASFQSTAAANCAVKGKVTHTGGIESVAFTGDLINNARTYTRAAEGIENNKPIVAQLLGGGSMVNDSASFNVCTGPGNIVNNNPIKAIYGTPPPGWKPPF